MSDAEQVQQALAELWDVVKCRCNEAYTGRGLHDPDCECDSTDALQIVTDRIEELVKERDTAREYAGEVRKREMAVEDARISATDKLATCEKYRDAYAEMGRIGTQAVRDLEAKLAKAVEALESLIQQTHDCEKELTEDLHHVDFCGESEPLTKARATLAEIKGENKDGQ